MKKLSDSAKMTDNELVKLSTQSKQHYDFVCTVLLQRHRRLITFIANKYGNYSIPLEDRIAVCQIGFCEFVKVYDPLKANDTFIATWAIAKMKSELRLLTFEMFPWMNQPVTNQKPIMQSLNNNGTVTCEDELVSMLNISPIEFKQYEDCEPSQCKEPLQELIQKEAIAMIQKALKNVSERDRFIYEHMLGLFGKDEMSGLELAEELDLTHQRVYQIFDSVSKQVYFQIQDTYKVHDWH